MDYPFGHNFGIIGKRAISTPAGCTLQRLLRLTVGHGVRSSCRIGWTYRDNGGHRLTMSFPPSVAFLALKPSQNIFSQNTLPALDILFTPGV